jgi:hypothetical protein
MLGEPLKLYVNNSPNHQVHNFPVYGDRNPEFYARETSLPSEVWNSEFKL